MQSSEISVIIPAYNHERYIQDCVMSVINQSLTPHEVIVVDDGSTDCTLEICKKLRKLYPKLHIISQKNLGAHNALNRGIEAARGRYIAVLNSDDLFFPGKLAYCSKLIESEPELEFFAGGVEFIDEQGEVLAGGIALDWYQRAWRFYRESSLLGLSLLNENFVVTTSNMVFTKDFWEKSQGFQPLRYCHDLAFLLEATRIIPNFFIYKEPMIRYRIHSANTIKEDIQRVRVEIAAVIAQTVVDGKQAILGRDPKAAIGQLRYFLRNKNLSDLVIYFIINYLVAENKTKFFHDVLSEENKELFAQLLD